MARSVLEIDPLAGRCQWESPILCQHSALSGSVESHRATRRNFATNVGILGVNEAWKGVSAFPEQMGMGGRNRQQFRTMFQSHFHRAPERAFDCPDRIGIDDVASMDLPECQGIQLAF